MSISARLRQFLDEKGIKYVTVSHSPAYTSQEVAASLHVPGRELAKSVVVNADGGFALGVLPAPRRIDLGQLKKAAGARDSASPPRRSSRAWPADGPVISYPFALVKGAPQEAAEVVALADEVILLESGRMRARGVPRDVLRDLKPEASGSPGRSCP